MRILLSAAAVGVVLASCSPAPVPAPVCNTGDTRTCVGPGGCMGGQACLADGTGFGACDCGSTGGGGGTTTGGGSGGGGAVGGGSGGGGGSTTDAGDDAGTDAGIDAGMDDAGIDAGTDAGIDAGVDAGTDAGVDAGNDAGVDAGPPIIGELFFLEVATLNPGTSGTFLGQGREAQLSFHPLTAAVSEQMPGTPLGCKAWELSPADATAWALGVDEGAIDITATAATTFSGPTCSWTANAGYSCPFNSTASSGGIIGNGPQAGLATLTDLDVTFNAANTTNAYIRIQGAANVANDGMFPIVALGGANTIVYVNPAVVAETLPGLAFHANFAFAGGTPSVPDPGFLDDTAQLSLTLTPGGAMDFASFTAATTTTVGDDFVLSTQDLPRLNAVPRDGSSFSISCDSASCLPSSALFTLLDIVTTDGVTTGLSPFAMPPVLTKSVRIQCRALSANSITVPAAYSSFIQNSGATRIQTTFIRYNLMSGGPTSVTAGAGHAIRGFTN